MHNITLENETDFDGWRKTARVLALSDVRPSDVNMWRRYYASILNPARLKVKAMQNEMPRKYWRNLPEASSIKTAAA